MAIVLHREREQRQWEPRERRLWEQIERERAQGRCSAVGASRRDFVQLVGATLSVCMCVREWESGCVCVCVFILLSARVHKQRAHSE